MESGGTVEEVGYLLQALGQVNTENWRFQFETPDIKAAANVNAVMAQGKTPLHVAIQQSGCSKTGRGRQRPPVCPWKLSCAAHRTMMYMIYMQDV